MRALVLSGGGSHGAWQVGAIKALAERGLRWKSIYGVSVGAINGARLAQFVHPPNGAQDLERLWKEEIRGSASIYKKSLFYQISALTSKGGLASTAPLLSIIRRNLSVSMIKEAGIKYRCGAVDLISGAYEEFTEDSTHLDLRILASATFPVLMEPVRIEENWIIKNYVDGGVRNITPLVNAVVEPGVDAVDVIVCKPKRGGVLPLSPGRTYNTIDTALRVAELMADEIHLDDLALAKAHPEVAVNIYSPKSLITTDPMDFSPTHISMLIDLGYRETMGS